MKNFRILAVMLSFVLVAGLGTPAFAQLVGNSIAIPTQVFTPNHGNVDQNFTGPFTILGGIEPFIVPSGQTFTAGASNLVGVDVFVGVVTGGAPGTITVNVWDSNQPGSGNMVGSTTVNIDTTGIVFPNLLTVHLDFASIPLISGNTYALQFIVSDVTFGAAASCSNPYSGGTAWQGGQVPTCDYGFVTYYEDVVGGELLPIDSTALMIAGLQSSAIWMLPILAGAAGVGAFYIKTRMNKD